MARMTRQAIYFTAPHVVEVREEPLEMPARGEVLVAVALTAISPGTEMLIYRGLMPRGMKTDATIPALGGELAYPLKYGYASVGQVIAVGPGVSEEWRGRWVFAFQPHQSHYVAPVEEVVPLPEEVSPKDGVFLPNMETAVNFLMDGRPMIGERVLVFGQGIVGLLTTALLASMPLSLLVTLDRFPLRRDASGALGASVTLDPAVPDIKERLMAYVGSPEGTGGADLVYELSGAPEALNLAIALTGFNGRIIVGSWYGAKQAALDLGGHFHRSRMRIVSSQVSTLAPEHVGRWDKARRLKTAWEHVARVRPSRFITHLFPATQAHEAYRLIAQHPEQTIQVLLQWDTSI